MRIVRLPLGNITRGEALPFELVIHQANDSRLESSSLHLISLLGTSYMDVSLLRYYSLVFTQFSIGLSLVSQLFIS